MEKPTEYEGLIGFCASLAIYADSFARAATFIPVYLLVPILMVIWCKPVTIIWNKGITAKVGWKVNESK